MTAHQNLTIVVAGLIGTARGLASAAEEFKPEADKILLDVRRILNVDYLLQGIKVRALAGDNAKIIELLEMDLPEPP